MKKLSVSLSGHQTSISLEAEFITALREIATPDKKSGASIIEHIDTARTPVTNLYSAMREWVLRHVKDS